jgi:group I intron endonuclease
MSGCIYLVQNMNNGKTYIGQTRFKSPIRRWNAHINMSKHGSTLAIHSAIRKYGVDAFHFESLCSVPYDALNNMEAYYAEQYESYTWNNPGGYNMAWCGESKLTDETRIKISIKAKGRVISEEQRCKISETLKGRTGHKHTPEMCKFLSERMKGTKPTKESIEKMRQTKLSQNLKDKNKLLYGSSILTREQCDDIRSQKGIQTQKQLAMKYGVSLAHLGYIQRFICSEK